MSAAGLFLCLAAPGSAQAPDPPPHAATAAASAKAERAYLQGAKEIRAHEYSKAEAEFAQAAVLNPAHAEYVEALAIAREHRITELIQQAAKIRTTDAAHADAMLAEARSIDAVNPRLTQRDSADGSAEMLSHELRTEIAGSVVLAPTTGKQDVHLRGDVRTVASALAQAFGVHLIADQELTSKQIRLDLDRVDFSTAAQILKAMSGTLIVPLDEHTALIADDTAANRTRLERITEESFDLPGFSTEQVNDIANVARTVFEIRQVSVQPAGKTIVLRAPQDTLSAVDRIFRDLVEAGPEVILDLKLYTVDRSNARNAGLILPQQISGYSIVSEAASLVSQNASLIQQLIASGVLPANATQQQIAVYLIAAGLGNSALLKNTFLVFGGGLTYGALSTGNSPTLNLGLTQSDVRALDDMQLRVSDRQTATFRSGTRYPIQTSLYTDVASPTSPSTATINGVSVASLLASYLGSNTSGITSGSVLPQIQYEDLGLTLKAIPHVQREGNVGMHLEFKLDALAGSAINGIPILASRQVSSDLTLRDGETTMMVSYLSQSESAAVNGIPGLSEIPGFQSTTNQNKNVQTSELILVLTPHIVRRARPTSAGPYTALQTRPSPD